MLTNSAFIKAAVAAASNDSCAITWHQWQAEYPIDSKMGLSSRRALSSAAALHAYQSTGLWACCNKLGLVSAASALRCVVSSILRSCRERYACSIARLGEAVPAMTNYMDGRKAMGQVNTVGSPGLAPNWKSLTRATSLRIKSSSLSSVDFTLQAVTSPDGAMVSSNTTKPNSTKKEHSAR